MTFCYPDQETPALDDVSFRIEAGEKVGLIGRIGSGKSSIQRLVLGLYEPDQGAVMVDGTDVRQIDPADLRRSIGSVPQDVYLFFGSVKDNIAIGAPFTDDDTVRRAARIGDGWLMGPRTEPGDEMKILVETFHETAQAAGRDPAALGIDATVFAEDRGPNEWLSEAQAWRDIGATSVTFRTSESGFTHIDQHLEAMAKLAEAAG